MAEVWKDVVGYEGLYQVSNLGRLKSAPRPRTKGGLLKPQYDRKGYLTFGLCKNGKSKMAKIHRLVAEAFIPNPGKLPEVNHKDEQKDNNCVENLEWCTTQYNSNYGTRVARIAATKRVKTASAT